ncbi:hypothetical protein [Dolichospermum flos-aquae]|jgi:hypothetical protein|uniref:Uncharacterized protein n=1 Tax=Dolichospermum flos-aquae CCAP 1403/13F TaxID=315271 RepID=A0A6H2C4G7_DOLFA|nr:hypothetical protein [Dolichospermum flos-aquae]QJB46190.1 hypothetical protein HGD76_20435 [Dolichospermum flos-aquae CCAP 1403/13F]
MVTLNQEKHISNWNKDRDFILSLLPDDCLRYYQLGIEPRSLLKRK